ncbi:iron uptake porin [Cyanobium sp. WAJ14-Wanaka]|uniref:iron uptake porin n=1 Tax=Cyanobium sp. WAJ14-Wanaka TaxID=2823725 RepID=UPI0020CE636D|nr:iron uptake porin [Cyanobium sp. WAJ14-Wanaka]
MAPAAIADEQVTSISQFSDVKPTDWAYQALSNLIERYGCVAGYPNGTYKGGQAITRFEAAALLNACLDRVTETTDELKKLMSEFQKELAILKGRVDGLDARVGTLEANQFSTTTKLSGLATFVVGGVSNNPAGGQVTFNYDLQLSLDTSFTGKDLLRTVLRSGNFDGDRNAFGGGLSSLEIAFQEEGGPDLVGIDKLYYQFPIGGKFTATLGGRVGQEDMLALWPSAYPSDTILNVLTLNGAPLAYNKNLGPGFGLWWQDNGWSVSANYVAANAANSSEGLFNSASAGTSTVQLGYGKENWGIAAIYSYLDAGVDVPGATSFVTSQIAPEAGGGATTNAFGLSGFWQPSQAGWVPSISAGYGINKSSGNDLGTSQSWMVGLQWSDVLAKGNSFGMGLGQPAFASSTSNGATTESGVWAWEWWYQWQITDAISLTPAIFYLNNAGNQDAAGGGSQVGALVKTTFRF